MRARIKNQTFNIALTTGGPSYFVIGPLLPTDHVTGFVIDGSNDNGATKSATTFWIESFDTKPGSAGNEYLTGQSLLTEPGPGLNLWSEATAYHSVNDALYQHTRHRVPLDYTPDDQRGRYLLVRLNNSVSALNGYAALVVERERDRE